MNNRERLDILEGASSKLEKVLSFNKIIVDYISRGIDDAASNEDALRILKHNQEHYLALLDEQYTLTDDACNEIEEIIYELNTIEEEKENSSEN